MYFNKFTNLYLVIIYSLSCHYKPIKPDSFYFLLKVYITKTFTQSSWRCKSKLIEQLQ